MSEKYDSDHIPIVSRADVLVVIERDFPKRRRGAVLRLLDEYVQIDNQRLCLSFLKLSGGIYRRLRKKLMSSYDWRDILVSAEYPLQSRMSWSEFSSLTEEEKSRIRLDDWQEYCRWLGRVPT